MTHWLLRDGHKQIVCYFGRFDPITLTGENHVLYPNFACTYTGVAVLPSYGYALCFHIDCGPPYYPENLSAL